MSKKKVLIVNDRLQFGGSDLVAVRLEENLNKDKFECVYCVRRTEPGPLEAELIKRNARIIHVPDEKIGYFQSFVFYLELLKNERFDIVHSHLMFFSAIVLLAAKIRKVPVRVAHSHFSKPLFEEKGIVKLLHSIYRFLMRRLLKIVCNKMLACSIPTGEFLYGKKCFAKKGIVLNNGIDFSEYEFNQEFRDEIRSEFNIKPNDVLLGHIGQMWYAKNHSFLIDIFNEYHKQNKNSYLMLVSDGPLRDEIENKVNGLGLSDSVIFTGFRNDCNKLLMAMDCFVFPSIHEGFPLTLIEAQATKLPCVVSDVVTEVAKFNENFVFESIIDNSIKWVEAVNIVTQIERCFIDINKIKNEYDIIIIANELEKLYLN